MSFNMFSFFPMMFFQIFNLATLLLIICTLVMFIVVLMKLNRALTIWLRNNDTKNNYREY